MKRTILAALAAILFCVSAIGAKAQCVSITATNIKNSAGTKLANGELTFRPVDNNGKPIGYTVPSGTCAGEMTATPSTFTVTNGAIVSGALPDVSYSGIFPANVCFDVTVKDLDTGKTVLGGANINGYHCAQPVANSTDTPNAWCVSGTCNFDKFKPNLAGQVLVQTGPVGPTGATGATGPSGTLTNNTGFTIDAAAPIGNVVSGDGSLYKGVPAPAKNLMLYAGSNCGVKIQNANDAAPSTGVTLDARSCPASETITGFTITKPVNLFVCGQAWTLAAATSIAAQANLGIIGCNRSTTTITSANNMPVLTPSGTAVRRLTVKGVTIAGGGGTASFITFPNFNTGVTDFSAGLYEFDDLIVQNFTNPPVAAINAGNSVYMMRVTNSIYRNNKGSLFFAKDSEPFIESNNFWNPVDGVPQISLNGHSLAMIDKNDFERSGGNLTTYEDIRFSPGTNNDGSTGNTGYVWITRNKFGPEGEAASRFRIRIMPIAGDTVPRKVISFRVEDNTFSNNVDGQKAISIESPIMDFYANGNFLDGISTFINDIQGASSTIDEATGNSNMIMHTAVLINTSASTAFKMCTNGCRNFSRVDQPSGARTAEDLPNDSLAVDTGNQTNYLLYSEDQSNAAWVVNGTITRTAGQADDIGGTGATLLAKTAVSGNALTQVLQSGYGANLYCTVRAKAGTGDRFLFGFYDVTSSLMLSQVPAYLDSNWRTYTFVEAGLVAGHSHKMYIYPDGQRATTGTIYVGRTQCSNENTEYIPTAATKVAGTSGSVATTFTISSERLSVRLSRALTYTGTTNAIFAGVANADNSLAAKISGRTLIKGSGGSSVDIAIGADTLPCHHCSVDGPELTGASIGYQHTRSYYTSTANVISHGNSSTNFNFTDESNGATLINPHGTGSFPADTIRTPLNFSFNDTTLNSQSLTQLGGVYEGADKQNGEVVGADFYTGLGVYTETGAVTALTNNITTNGTTTISGSGFTTDVDTTKRPKVGQWVKLTSDVSTCWVRITAVTDTTLTTNTAYDSSCATAGSGTGAGQFTAGNWRFANGTTTSNSTFLLNPNFTAASGSPPGVVMESGVADPMLVGGQFTMPIIIQSGVLRAKVFGYPVGGLLDNGSDTVMFGDCVNGRFYLKNGTNKSWNLTCGGSGTTMDVGARTYDIQTNGLNRIHITNSPAATATISFPNAVLTYPASTSSTVVSSLNADMVDGVHHFPASATLTFTSIAAQTSQEQTMTITGASTTNFGASCSPRATLGNANVSWSAWVSATNTVSVRVTNPTAGAVTPSAVVWGCTVSQ